jgi:hypothetical protein
MQPSLTPAPKTEAQVLGDYSPWKSQSKSVLFTLLILGGISGALLLPPLSSDSADKLSEAKQQERRLAFEAITNLKLKHISDADVPAAVGGMRLNADAKKALLADLKSGSTDRGANGIAPGKSLDPNDSSPSVAKANPGSQAPIKKEVLKRSKSSPVAGQSRPDVRPLTTPPLRLAWITLWDTDAEDGDTVRIDSAGFSQTVVLSNTPMTIAVPVISDGDVQITGAHDGTGGITVGVASGGAKIAFPIMSVGQTLGVRIQVD